MRVIKGNNKYRIVVEYSFHRVTTPFTKKPPLAEGPYPY